MKKVMIGFGLFLAATQVFAWNDYNYNDYQINTYSNVSYTQNNDGYSVCAVALTRELHLGSENSEVSTLQDYLHDAGYLIAAPNGYFGVATRNAVMIFQQDNDIFATGSVGQSTRQEINDAICNVDSSSYSSSYGFPTVSPTTQIPTTYVGNIDPFIQPTLQNSYSLPNNTNFFSISNNTQNYPAPNFTSNYNNSYNGNYPTPTVNTNVVVPSILPALAPIASQIQGTSIVLNPATGYVVGITQKPSSLTIAAPRPNTFYTEGDTINISWTSSNLTNPQYQVLLENTATTQSRPVTTTSGNTASILLTKELLDAVCAGSCSANQQEAFRIVISTPVTDIAGVTTKFRATVSPINVKRAVAFLGGVSITATKTPVNSGEAFKLYTSIPTGTLLDSNNAGLYSIRIHAICPVTVTVSIAGIPCGSDIPVPFDAPFFNQQIPVTATSTSWYKQDVIFEIVVVNNLGQTMTTSRTTVTVNPNPFNW